MACTSYAAGLLCQAEVQVFNCLSAGLAVLEVIQEEELQKNANEVGDYLLQQLKPLQKVRPHPTLTYASSDSCPFAMLCVMHAC